MSVHLHRLKGCAPSPLAHYLKALGVFRLVAEQADPAARGWWAAERFHLATTLSEAELIGFFRSDYRPTPLVAPWNGGSGFYPNDNRSGIDPIRESRSPRLALYRATIEDAEARVAGLEKSLKNEEKSALLAACRAEWRGPALEWLEAAIVIDESGEPAYPALLGTGGNDGRLEFTNNFMRRIAELFDLAHPDAPARPEAEALLRAALFGGAEPGLAKSAIGQFLPGGAGGPNSVSGFSGDARVNPWDFVLTLEGTILFTAAVTRRMRVRALPQAAAPFAVRNAAVAYGSAAEAEKDRGEQWLPLWERPAGLGEVRALIAEGRSQIGVRPAERAVDFARAVARLGVARGISAFERYAYLERNGRNMLAVPLGRWPVSPQPHQNLVDQAADWVDRVRRAGASKHAPASIARAARVCEEAILACCRDGGNPARWQTLLMALGDAEAQLPRSPRFTAARRLQPLPKLLSGWLEAADDGSAELRLASALASQYGPMRKDDGEWDIDWSDPVRRQFLPLDASGRRFLVQTEAVARPPETVCTTGDLVTDAIELVRRRIVEAGQRSLGQIPLLALDWTAAGLDDVNRFLAADVDEARILHLARPLMAIEWAKVRARRGTSGRHAPTGAMAAYGVVRLAHWPLPLRVDTEQEPASIPLDPSIFARLVAGDLARASDTAIRRLGASGLRPYVRQLVGSPEFARRIAAALAFPIATGAARALAHRLARPTLEDTPTPPQEAMSP